MNITYGAILRKYRGSLFPKSLPVPIQGTKEFDIVLVKVTSSGGLELVRCSLVPIPPPALSENVNRSNHVKIAPEEEEKEEEEEEE